MLLQPLRFIIIKAEIVLTAKNFSFITFLAENLSAINILNM